MGGFADYLLVIQPVSYYHTFCRVSINTKTVIIIRSLPRMGLLRSHGRRTDETENVKHSKTDDRSEYGDADGYYESVDVS